MWTVADSAEIVCSQKKMRLNHQEPVTMLVEHVTVYKMEGKVLGRCQVRLTKPLEMAILSKVSLPAPRPCAGARHAEPS